MRFVLAAVCILASISASQARPHRHHHTSMCVETGSVLFPVCGMNAAEAPAKPHKERYATRITHRRHYAVRINRSAGVKNEILSFPSYNPAKTIATVANRIKDVSHRISEVVGGRPNGCPHAYCGCGTSLKVFGKIIPSLNLAVNWGRFPSAGPEPGHVAYRRHHVFYIMQAYGDGTVLAYDSNSGHGLTRIHRVSLRGYRVVNPHG